MRYNGRSKLNFLHAPVPPTVFNRFLSKFQGVLSLPCFTTYRPGFFYIAHLRSAEGHDFGLMLKPMGKIFK